MGMFQTLGRVLGPKDTLKIECGGCGRRKAWPRALAFAAFGEHAAPYDIRRRLVCGKCGDKSKVRVWV